MLSVAMRRRIAGLILSSGLLLFSVSALHQVQSETLDQDRSPTAKARLASNWTRVTELENGDENHFNSVASNGLSILKRAPLEEDVLTQIALARHTALTLNRERRTGALDESSLALLRTAQDRNPRNRTVANTLYRDALNTGQFDEAVAQIDLRYRVTHPQNSERREFVSLLGALISLDPSRPSVEQALTDAPIWGGPLLRYLYDNRLGASLRDTAGYLALYAQKADPADAQRIAEGLIRRLVQNDQFETAHEVWTQYWPLDQQSQRTVLNADPGFQRTAPAPFGWLAFAGRHGSADFEPTGGLYAVYHNGPETVLAEQVFLWPAPPLPGLKIHVQGMTMTDPRTGRFQINLDCYVRTEDQSDFVSIGQVVLNETFSEKGEASAFFLNPNPDCRTGRIRLVGTSGEFSQTISATVQSISVSTLLGDEE